MSLVLDGIDGSLGSPVDGISEIGGVQDLDVVLLVELGSEEFLVFGLGPGGHVVVSDGEGVGCVGVDHVVFGVLLVEEGKSESVLLLGSVGDSEVSEMLDESLLDMGFDGGGVIAHVKSDESGGGTESVHLKVIN